MAEPNQLKRAAVPNTIGSTPPRPGPEPSDRSADATSGPAARPSADDGLAIGLDELADFDDLDDLEDVDAFEYPSFAGAAASAVSSAELDRRIRAAVQTTLADQTQTIAVAKRRGRIGFVAGLLLAAVGIPLFFGASLLSEEIGIALICLGIGIGLLSVLLASARADVAASRQSTTAAIVTTLLLPHTAVVWLVALALVAFGLLMLLVAAQTG
jgi:hypothetical protein